MKYLKIFFIVALQLAIVVYLSLLAQKGLEVIPVPDVFKNMSLIELEDLDRSILQSAVDLKSKFVSTESAVDSNIIIINVEAINPIPRGEVAKAIKFLKDHGAKTIALDLVLDQSYDHLDPTWDRDLAEAITYKENNIIGFNGFHYNYDDNNKKDTQIIMQPIEKLSGFHYVGFGNLEMTPENEGQIVQQFFPNYDFRGQELTSFPLAIAEHFDSLRASSLENKQEKEYVNFYRKELFKIWNMSFLTNPIISGSFAPFVKGKLFIFGYINPESDAIRSNVYATPIGKLEESLVYAGIVSDILTHKFVPESPFLVDMMIGALFCLFNILLYMTAMKKTIGWEKFTGVILIPLEIVVIYMLVIFIFVFFNYKLSVIIPSIVIMISVPFNSFSHKTIIPFLLKIIALIKYRSVPYPLLQQFLNIFEHEKRSTRHMTTIFSLQRIFWILRAVSGASTGSGISNSELSKIKSWESLKEFSSIQANETNRISGLILDRKDYNLAELEDASKEYYKLFTHNNLKRELYARLEEEKDIDPGKDKFRKLLRLFNNFFVCFEKEFQGYMFLYVTQKNGNSYLVRDITKRLSEATYINSDVELKTKSIYLHKRGTNEFISLEPFMYYKQCKYHKMKELFVFSDKQFDEYEGSERSHYIGEYFMCSPSVPPKD